MTFAEALRELGVEPNATAMEARLSYLRRIEMHQKEQDHEASERIRKAYELVFPLLEARERELGTARDDEVEQWLGHLHRKEVAAAIPKIIASLETAARLHSAGRIPGGAILDLISELAASGDAIRARSLVSALGAWVASLPSPGDAFSQEDQPRWVLLQELAAAEPELAHTTYVTLGRLLAANDASLAGLLMRHQFSHPEQAARDHATLSRMAPTLAKAFGQFLVPQAEPIQNPRQIRAAQGWLWLMALIIGANVLRICSDAQRPPPPGQYPAEDGVFRDEGATQDAPNAEARIERARLDLSRWLSPRGEEQFADSAADALLHRDCQAAHSALTKLDERTEALPDEAEPSVRALWSEFALKCSGPPTPR